MNTAAPQPTRAQSGEAQHGGLRPAELIPPGETASVESAAENESVFVSESAGESVSDKASDNGESKKTAAIIGSVLAAVVIAALTAATVIKRKAIKE